MVRLEELSLSSLDLSFSADLDASVADSRNGDIENQPTAQQSSSEDDSSTERESTNEGMWVPPKGVGETSWRPPRESYFRKSISDAYEDSALESAVGGVGTFLSDGNKALGALAGGITSGLGSLNSFLGLGGGALGGGGGGSAPNVPNGGILPGPGNSALGVSYVRDVLLPGVTNWIVALVLSGSVVVMIGAGLMYIVGGGDQEMQTKAREAIMWAVIGACVTMLAYALVRIIIGINFFG